MKDIITKYLVSSLVVTSLPSILIATLMCDKFVDWREKILYLITVVVCVIVNMIVLSIHDDIQRKEY